MWLCRLRKTEARVTEVGVLHPSGRKVIFLQIRDGASLVSSEKETNYISFFDGVLQSSPPPPALAHPWGGV
jgi:hypothetical protein